MSPEEMRDALADLRRHLVGVVGILERIGGIEPVCRVCAGCTRCEALHRQQNVVQSTQRDRVRTGPRPSSN